jgi:hypothetical protein
MKQILLMFLFGTMTMFSQTIKVKGVTLSYDKIKKIMTLTTTPKIMYTNDKDMDVKIEINKEFALRMTIGGVNYSVSEPYFDVSLRPHKLNIRRLKRIMFISSKVLNQVRNTF